MDVSMGSYTQLTYHSKNLRFIYTSIWFQQYEIKKRGGRGRGTKYSLRSTDILLMYKRSKSALHVVILYVCTSRTETAQVKKGSNEEVGWNIHLLLSFASSHSSVCRNRLWSLLKQMCLFFQPVPSSWSFKLKDTEGKVFFMTISNFRARE